MNPKQPIVGAKILTMLGFLVLLSTTYILRRESPDLEPHWVFRGQSESGPGAGKSDSSGKITTG
jgi:hypothetical protein